MAKKRKNRWRIRLLLLVVVVLAVLGAGITYLFAQQKEASIVQSDTNRELFKDAIKQKDPAICDQIEGGISAPSKEQRARGTENITKPFSESEVKAMCVRDSKQ